MFTIENSRHSESDKVIMKVSLIIKKTDIKKLERGGPWGEKVALIIQRHWCSSSSLYGPNIEGIFNVKTRSKVNEKLILKVYHLYMENIIKLKGCEKKSFLLFWQLEPCRLTYTHQQWFLFFPCLLFVENIVQVIRNLLCLNFSGGRDQEILHIFLTSVTVSSGRRVRKNCGARPWIALCGPS